MSKKYTSRGPCQGFWCLLHYYGICIQLFQWVLKVQCCFCSPKRVSWRSRAAFPWAKLQLPCFIGASLRLLPRTWYVSREARWDPCTNQLPLVWLAQVATSSFVACLPIASQANQSASCSANPLASWMWTLSGASWGCLSTPSYTRATMSTWHRRLLSNQTSNCYQPSSIAIKQLGKAC